MTVAMMTSADGTTINIIIRGPFTSLQSTPSSPGTTDLTATTGFATWNNNV
jgi:hypothetical protein